MPRRDTASRLIAVPCEQVHAALVDYPDRSTTTGKTTAATDVVEDRFVDLVPGVRVVQAVDFVSDDPAYGGTMTVSWELVAVEGGPRVEVTADDVPDAVSPEDHAAGMASSLAKLAKHLEGSLDAKPC